MSQVELKERQETREEDAHQINILLSETTRMLYAIKNPKIILMCYKYIKHMYLND